MAAGLDPRFTSLPLDALADAALSRATALGATHADVRIARIRNGERIEGQGGEARVESGSHGRQSSARPRVLRPGIVKATGQPSPLGWRACQSRSASSRVWTSMTAGWSR